jgi:PIN domain nuclease of toxin-antitoxin system
MRALLDTHTFLWWNIDDPRLSQRARDFIADGRNEIYFSAASAWEIAIKAARGSLILPEPPGAYVAKRLSLHKMLVLPIQVSHALHFLTYQICTRPFDRLIGSKQMEGLPIITGVWRCPLPD